MWYIVCAAHNPVNEQDVLVLIVHVVGGTDLKIQNILSTILQGSPR